jgi:hypothetical protein
MAKRKTTGKTKKAEEPVSPQVMAPGGVIIEPLEPDFSLETATMGWFGSPKCGKTSTFCALGTVAEEYGIDDVKPFLMLFEAGSGGATVRCTSEPCKCGGKKKDCSDCKGQGAVRKVLSSLEEVVEWFEWAAKSEYNLIGIDTCDAMYQLVCDGVCKRLGINTPSDLEFGVAWSQIYDEMRELLAILTRAGKGIVLLMHVYYQERRVRGGTIQVATFNITGKSRPYIAGLCDQLLFFDVQPNADDEDRHTITVKATAGIEAGDRWGVFPDTLDRGESAEDGAKAILSCFGYEFG